MDFAFNGRLSVSATPLLMGVKWKLAVVAVTIIRSRSRKKDYTKQPDACFMIVIIMIFMTINFWIKSETSLGTTTTSTAWYSRVRPLLSTTARDKFVGTYSWLYQ